jgi:hypothetical protein
MLTRQQQKDIISDLVHNYCPVIVDASWQYDFDYDGSSSYPTIYISPSSSILIFTTDTSLQVASPQHLRLWQRGLWQDSILIEDAHRWLELKAYW